MDKTIVFYLTQCDFKIFLSSTLHVSGVRSFLCYFSFAVSVYLEIYSVHVIYDSLESKIKSASHEAKNYNKKNNKILTCTNEFYKLAS